VDIRYGANHLCPPASCPSRWGRARHGLRGGPFSGPGGPLYRQILGIRADPDTSLSTKPAARPPRPTSLTRPGTSIRFTRRDADGDFLGAIDDAATLPVPPAPATALPDNWGCRTYILITRVRNISCSRGVSTSADIVRQARQGRGSDRQVTVLVSPGTWLSIIPSNPILLPAAAGSLTRYRIHTLDSSAHLYAEPAAPPLRGTRA